MVSVCHSSQYQRSSRSTVVLPTTSPSSPVMAATIPGMIPALSATTSIFICDGPGSAPLIFAHRQNWGLSADTASYSYSHSHTCCPNVILTVLLCHRVRPRCPSTGAPCIGFTCASREVIVALVSDLMPFDLLLSFPTSLSSFVSPFYCSSSFSSVYSPFFACIRLFILSSDL